MDKLPAYILQAVNEYKPVEVDGLMFYPFKVRHYEQFLIAKKSIGFMTQQLPIELMSMPLLSSLFLTDYLMAVSGEQSKGLFTSVLVALAYSLRLTDGGTVEEACNKFELIVDPDDHSCLKAVRFILNGEEIYDITPIKFARIRTIIAAQNGIEIIDEDANPELVQAEYDLAESKALKLNFSPHEMVHSVAALTNTDESEIYDWPILKLHNRMQAFKRVFDYVICGIGESQGTKWKGGNPSPNPWFDRTKDGSPSLIGIDSFAGGQTAQTIREGEAARRYNESDSYEE